MYTLLTLPYIYRIKLRTLFAIFCFRSQRRVFRSQKKKIFSDRAQTYFGHVSSNFPTFFCRFFFHYFFFPSFTPRLPRVLLGTISSAPVQGRRNVKRLYGAQDPGLQTVRGSFAHNQTLTHTTWLNSAN